MGDQTVQSSRISLLQNAHFWVKVLLQEIEECGFKRSNEGIRLYVSRVAWWTTNQRVLVAQTGALFCSALHCRLACNPLQSNCQTTQPQYCWWFHNRKLRLIFSALPAGQQENLEYGIILLSLFHLDRNSRPCFSGIFLLFWLEWAAEPPPGERILIIRWQMTNRKG